MRVLSLFSGGGLGDYGLTLAGMEIVGQVEIDEYCQKILSLRWPDVPKWRDIKNVTGKEVLERCGAVDLVSGGFPCQPFSVAGAREGSEDSRHLWPEMSRIIREVRPRWVLAENVTGLLSISDGRVFGEVVRDLASCGYIVEWDCIPASAVGANHQRDRIWILGYSEHFGRTTTKINESTSQRSNGNSKRPKQTSEFKRSSLQSEKLANPTSKRLERKFWQVIEGTRNGLANSNWWKVEPSICRMVNGCPNRMERIKLLGNGQVPQVVQWIGEKIMQFDKENR